MTRKFRPHQSHMDSIASWNIRGLNWPNKQEDVNIFLHANKIGLVGLLETKIKEHNVQKVANKMFHNWEWIHNFSLNPKGRIWLAWRPNAYQTHLVHKTDQLIHCKVTQLSTKKNFYLSMIYGMNQESQRVHLWKDLQDIAHQMDEAWCLMGDFNTLRFKDDRIGGNEVQEGELRELANLLETCEIHELKSTGAYFSWTNRTIWSRIDHVFLNDLWYDVFDYTHSSYLANSLSDHTPIILQFPSSPKARPNFQYCDMWSKHKDFERIITTPKHSTNGSAMDSLCWYLNRIRAPLRRLNKDHFSDLKNQQSIARKSLEVIQQAHHQHPEDMLLAQQEKEARERYSSILSSSLDLIKQQCKLEWIRYGDDSTRLFFAKAKQRKLSTYIYSLKDQAGNQVEGFDQVGHTMFLFYRDLLGTTSPTRSTIDMEVISQGNVLTSDQQIRMCRPFTYDDIKDAIWSIPNHKSPGPDGFSSGFYKTTWAHTGPLVCLAVLDFFKTATMPRALSTTKLILLPKVPNPQQANEFRPISCCNVIYKCITKLIGQRIKEILPMIIHPSQGAFVPGRELLYNVLLCQDLARGYQRKNISPRYMLKIDIQEAFDSVHWDFLKDMLTAMRFPRIFITWIMSCITSVFFSIHINGQNVGDFPGKRGLKQGDPLSPLMFVLSMEYFSRLMHKSSLERDFKFHPHCKPLRLSHLMFADDLIIFSKADLPTLRHIKSALNDFHDCAGLKANMLKSQMVVGGCNPQLQDECLNITGFAEATFPLKYLGVPITASRLTKVECHNLIEKILNKVRIWTTRHLSFAGRAMLINSVVFGMINYWASIFVLPTSVIEKLTQICRNFLWGGSADYSTTPKVAWHSVCLDKKYGGLGIKDLAAWNKALIAKQVWAVAQKKDLLWVKWVHGRYLKRTLWWDYTPNRDCSWYWKKICFTKEFFKDACTSQQWDWQGTGVYRVKNGYNWQIGTPPKVPWAKLVWARSLIPRHAFISWVLAHRRLPTKVRLSKFQQLNTICSLCHSEDEDEQHILFTCPYAQEVWRELQEWWTFPKNLAPPMIMDYLLSTKGHKAHTHISYAIFAAGIYYIWKARNLNIFQGKKIPSHSTTQTIKEQVRNRIFFLNNMSQKFNLYVDRLLNR